MWRPSHSRDAPVPLHWQRRHRPCHSAPRGTPCQTQGSGSHHADDHTRRVGREPPRGSHGGRRRHGTARGHRAAAIEPRPGRARRTAGGLAGGHAARRRRPPHPRRSRAPRPTACRARRCCSTPSWTEDGAAGHHRLVARVAPGADDVPVFPRYDLPGQFEAIRLVGELTDVPVPTVWWCEPDAARLGAPFFVMGRVDGRVPPDVMPYNFGDSWLYDADPADQRHLQDATVDVLARLHAIDRPTDRFAFLVARRPAATRPAAPPCRRSRRAWYEFAAARRLPVAAGRARASPGSTTTGPTDEGDAVLELGRLADRQHDVRRLRPRGGARLGDGRRRPPRARRGLADLRPPHLRGHRRAVGPGGHARLPAPRRRRRHLRGGAPATPPATSLVRHLRRAAVRHRLPAHRRPLGALRRDRAARRRPTT